jgi:hypothetical protein
MKSRLPHQAVFALRIVAAAASLAPALSAQASSESGVPAQLAPVATFESGRRLDLIPDGDLFAPYIADPHRPVFALQGLVFADTAVEDSGSVRSGLKAGGRFGLLRLSSRQSPREWQLSFEAGIDAQFDGKHGLDNVGWDGNYGFTLTTAAGGALEWKLGVLHTSSHIGDEYAERTGRTRIGYTREEVTAALGWRFHANWRTYLELGYAYKNNSDVQEPGRGQVGLEYERPGSLWGGRMGYYAALDVQAMEEHDWSPGASLQTGLLLLRGVRRWRLGVEAYSGRVPLGEFYQDEETYVALGIWVDV